MKAATAARPSACEAYLARLPLDEATCAELARAGICADGNRRDDFAALHGALAGQPTIDGASDPGSASLAQRLRLAFGTRAEPPVPAGIDEHGCRLRLSSAPPLNRSPMAPRAWMPASAPAAGSGDAPGADARRRRRFGFVGPLRRSVLLAATLGQTYLATSAMSAVLPYHGKEPLEVCVLVLYAILFFWISAGFWTAICGFLVHLRGGDRHAISHTARPDAPIAADARTAVVMPICNEDVARVFAGLRATWASLARSGELARFDFFVLSDSNDADTRVAEVHAWLAMCRELDAFGRVFYRWRQHRIKRKSGNIADFCRRWGKNYRYMVVLDADSVMSGDCLVRLARLMEANPDTGIIQTAPRAAGRDTFYARMQQFATRLYGPLFTAGLHFWQLGESHYWGHNAIIRVAPFTRHCALARLPGRGALSGEILSHDFVEAALMRRAGWAVWLAYDLDGSYEEMPPNLVDELKRDRRWCHGNLMNVRLSLARGLHPAHRAVFMTGAMAYLSAPLWFLFLILSTVLLAIHTLAEPQYFVEPNQLFPLWPEWRPQWAGALFLATASLLFLPKILAVLLAQAKGARRFGGALRVAASMLVELVLSALLAPIRMLFHTGFVLAALAGIRTQWKSPPRADAETGWGEALRRHGLHSLIGIGWAGFVWWLNPAFLWWLLPVVGALALSVPISVFTSRVGLGRRLRRARLFLIPEETHPPRELREMSRQLRRMPPLPDFVDAVVDPLANALMCAAGNMRLHDCAKRRDGRRELIAAALRDGPAGLGPQQRTALLNDPQALSQLHFEIWSAGTLHPGWHDPARAPHTAADRHAGRPPDAQTPIPRGLRGARGGQLACAAPGARRGPAHS